VQIYETIDSVRKALDHERERGRVIGFVPTMGALHDGHLSLMEKARSECDFVLISIFVNPLQFNRPSDLTLYPKPFEADVNKAQGVGVDGVFAPAVDEMYPGGVMYTKVSVAEIGESLEGAQRLGHFDGVATVVAKLLGISGPCRAYFGEKDWQQLAVVRRMVADLSIPVEIIAGATVREPDGLALSSRNVRLDPEQRASALALRNALAAGISAFRDGVTDAELLHQRMIHQMEGRPHVEVQYAEVVGPDLIPVSTVDEQSRLVVAANVGDTRLIDNASPVDQL